MSDITAASAGRDEVALPAWRRLRDPGDDPIPIGDPEEDEGYGDDDDDDDDEEDDGDYDDDG